MRPRLRIVAAGGAVVVAAAATVVGVDLLRPTGSGCADLLVVGARGSGERVDEAQPAGFGREAGAVATAVVTAAQGRGWNVRTAGVDYPAIPEPEARADPSAFEASVDAGVADAVATVRAVAGCPSTRIVLIGSSQGAAVVHRAVDELSDGSSAGSSTGAVGTPLGAVLLGDPLRRRDETGVEFQDLDGVAVHDGFLAASAPQTDPGTAWAGHVLEVCSSADTVCSAATPGWDALVVSPAHHTAYTQDAVVAGIVGWLGRRADEVDAEVAAEVAARQDR